MEQDVNTIGRPHGVCENLGHFVPGHSRSASFGSSSDSDYCSSLDSGPVTEKRSSLADSIISLVTSLNVTDSEQLEQLDRENAHFSLSESIIETLEMLKCDQLIHSNVQGPRTSYDSRPVSRQSSMDSTKQWIRIRRPRHMPSSSSTASVSSLGHLNDFDDSESVPSLNELDELDAFEGCDELFTEELDALETSGCLLSDQRKRCISVEYQPVQYR
ncbi:hypothetical protein HDE_03517 [Halotydeus destructor]|nr:hypothetical protein HDE_03517 [Halotydeus destructor]